MINIPEWKLTLCEPLYDTASTSPIEQTAQVYRKMRELVEEYNAFTTEVTNIVNKFIEDSIADTDEFKNSITCLINNYIETLDNRMNEYILEVESKIDTMIAEGIIRYNAEAEEVVIGG